MNKKNGLGSRPPLPTPPLSLKATFGGVQLVVIGGTGFLGKVFWVLLLHRYPEIARLHLVVRAKHGQTAEQRFWREVATSDCLSPLREQHGEGFEAFLREKIRVLDGDIVQPMCGIESEVRDTLRQQVHAVVNVSGIVDFQPPLDLALEVNAFGMQSLVHLARDLGGVPVLHTSTCYVAGRRPGIVEEVNPLDHPFPYAGALDPKLWDPDREIAECLDIIEQAKHRANDAFRESHFLAQAKSNLTQAGEPAKGAVLEAEIQRVRRKFVEQQLAAFGQERAHFWGWPNTYTYTKSIGEQIVAKSKLPFTIVRPAIVESCLEFPVVGWNEGVNTSAPLIFAVREGQLQFPGAAIRLDIIPCDMVATGIALALAELLDGTQKAVYQFGTSDSNPTTMARIYELSGLYKRRHFKRTGRGDPLTNFLQSHVEGALMPTQRFERIGPRAIARGVDRIAGWLEHAPKGPVADMIAPTTKNLRKFARQQAKIADVVGQFAPFTAELDYEFRCDNTRAAHARLSDEERAQLFWRPERIDWRDWFLEVHVPGLERWVFPELEKRLSKPLRPLRRHETLSRMLEEMAERHGLAVALQRVEPDGFSRLSFREWHERSLACAARLAALGVQPGHRVVLLARNHPDWPIAFFGISYAGATVVPLDPELDEANAEMLLAAALAKVVVVDEAARQRLGAPLRSRACLLLGEAAQPGPATVPVVVQEDDIAVLSYTLGTSGQPKGVLLSHRNLTSLLASLAPLFPLSHQDRMLSVLPLHHTFELTCGMLLPLSRGTRIVYLGEGGLDGLDDALERGRVTGMVGVPALWSLLEQKVLARVSERGDAAARVFELGLQFNRMLGGTLGVDAGRLLFGEVHRSLGGHLRYLVSGGARLNPETHRLFAGLGLHVSEGYGLTEAAPVLSVSQAGPRTRPGQVGRAIPGVELRIDQPNAEGIGEVLARGPNVMVGYAGDPVTTLGALEDGWLKTGDLGQLDHRGRLQIVGRSGEVIETARGERLYPDEVEAGLGAVTAVAELVVLGLRDARGRERVGLVGVVREGHEASLEQARDALLARVLQLPVQLRPERIEVRTEPLPRTATGQVKRSDVRTWLERRYREAPPDQGGDLVVRSVLAELVLTRASELSGEVSLRGELGYDAVLLLEAHAALQERLGRTIDPERFQRCISVADVEALVRQPTVHVERPERDAWTLPEGIRKVGQAWLGEAAGRFYSSVMRTRVTGRAFIPRNRNVLVVANHQSRLDPGLVRHALGEYGKRLVALTGRESFGDGIARATELLAQGHVVLLFPEGAPSRNGSLQEFQPLVGAVALGADVDVLPVWLGGTFEALPRGATLLRGRDLVARIGLPLERERLRAHTRGRGPADAARQVAALAQKAVSELGQGRVFELSERPSREQDPGASRDVPKPVVSPASAPPPEAASSAGAPTSTPVGGSLLGPVFAELEARFKPGSVKRPMRYYFSLGDEKLTLILTPSAFELALGPTQERADCVLKTTPELFSKMVMEGYTPGTREVLSGVLKTNNVGALKDLQRIFELQKKRSPGKGAGAKFSRGGTA